MVGDGILVRCAPVGVFLVAVLAASRGVAGPTPVSTCGATVHGAAYLPADLDCTGYAGDAITLDRGTLDLRGHTLTGGQGHGIQCQTQCKVFSVPANGRITGCAKNGINGGDYLHKAKVKVDSVIITNNTGSGVFADESSVIRVTNSTVTGNGATPVIYSEGGGVFGRGATVAVVNSTVSNNTGIGIGSVYSGYSRATVTNATVSGNTIYGVQAWSMKIKHSQITNSGSAGVLVPPGYRTATIIDSTISGNGQHGVQATTCSLTIKSSSVANNIGDGVQFGTIPHKSVTIKDSMVTGNTRNGVSAYGDPKLTVTRSTIKGNMTDPACNGGVLTCADLDSASAPHFDFVAGTYECDVSYRAFAYLYPCTDCPPGLYPALQWGVCLQDCNNGVLNGAEVCDTGGDSATCDDNCTPAMCGDQTVNAAAGEECDDGNTIDTDGCLTTCKLAVCGDGFVRPGYETCDDGNLVSCDGCDKNCQVSACGNRIRCPGEQCDDGNLDDGDGCSSTCQRE